jgi:hypothetical protein
MLVDVLVAHTHTHTYTHTHKLSTQVLMLSTLLTGEQENNERMGVAPRVL